MKRSLMIAILMTATACSGQLVIDDVGPGSGMEDPGGASSDDPGAGDPGPSGDEGDGDSSSPDALFAAVQTSIRGQCAVCHEDGGVGPELFGAPGDADDYDAVVEDTVLNGQFDPAAATLLNKGAHSGAAWWTDAQIADIEAWLAAEQAAGR